jgi:hypothetical protein
MSQTKIDLSLKFADNFEPEIEESLMPHRGDLSQLGLRRGRLNPLECFPLVEEAEIFIETSDALNHPVVRKVFPVPKLEKDEVVKSLRITITTMGVNGWEFSQAEIAAMQKAITPKAGTVIEPLLQDKRIPEYIKKLETQVDLFLPSVCAFISSRAAVDNDLVTWLTANDVINTEESTITSAINVQSKDLAKLDYGKLLTLKLRLKDLPKTIAEAFDRLELIKMVEIGGITEAILSHSVLEALVTELYAEYAIQKFEAPAQFDEWIKIGNRYKDIIVNFDYIMDVTGVEKPVKVKDTMYLFSIEFALFALLHKQAGSSIEEHNWEVGFTRVLLVRHALLTGSTERQHMNMNRAITMSSAAIDYFYLNFKKPETIYSCMYLSAISFLKSGHHATALNIDKWLEKILGSLGIQADASKCQRLINSSVYWGTHPANMLYLVTFMYHRAKQEKITGALAYRMRPVPPTFAAYCNLELYIDALNATGFFDLMDIKNKYVEFKVNLKIIKTNMHLSSPYAHYLYGETRDDPSSSKSAVAAFGAYAVAIDAVLPNGTLNLSPALRKLAENEGKNSINAKIQVDAFVKAYRRFYSQIVEGNLTKTLGRAPARALTEE